MKLPLPTYQKPANFYNIAEAISMFVTKIDAAIKYLTTEPNMQFHSKNHLIQMIMFYGGLFSCEETFHDVENYLGENLEVLLRDYGVRS